MRKTMSQHYLNNLFNLQNKVVLITGATGQLGTAFCKAFSLAGAKVVGLDSNLNNNNSSLLPNCKYYNLDVRDKEGIIKRFKSIYESYGRLDILINNAGVSCFEPFEERPEESFDWVMDVNLKGVFFCIQSYVNILKKSKQKGNIVNIASMYGVISPDYRIYTDCDRKNSEVYGATKAGVIQMTRYFAAHLASHQIRINSISPGGILNPVSPQGQDFQKNFGFRCPLGRMANVDELIGGILYLSSEAASYTTGHNLIIDGGMNCW